MLFNFGIPGITPGQEQTNITLNSAPSGFIEIGELVHIWGLYDVGRTNRGNNFRTVDFSGIYPNLNQIYMIQATLKDADNTGAHKGQQIILRTFNPQAGSFQVDALDLTSGSSGVQIFYYIIGKKNG